MKTTRNGRRALPLPRLALAALALAPSLSAQQVWVPLTPGVPPGTPASVDFDEAASTVSDSFFDIHIPGFWQEQIVHEGQTYQQIEVPGLGRINQEGAPDLPVVRLPLAVATDASLVVLAALEDLDPHVFDLRPYPTGTEALENSDQGALPSEFVRDDLIYGGTSKFPGEQATGALVPSPRLGSIRAVEHEVFPARWDPATDAFAISGQLRVHYAAPGQVVEQPAMTLDRAALAAATFPNWPDQKDFFPPDTVEYAGRYLIVTPQNYVWSLADFIDKKKSQGFTVDTLVLEHTLPQPTICGNLRAAMGDWYELGDPADDHYALLVGDYHQIPWCGAPAYKPTYTDDLYGSPIDGDLDEEIYIGRISPRNNTDLRGQLDKIMAYMDDQDGDHYDQALLVAAGEGAPGKYVGCMNDVVDGIYASAPDFQKLYGLGVTNVSWHIVEAINAGKGLVAYRGHGWKYGWSKWNVYNENFDTSDLGSLTNADETSVVWSITCDTGVFDGDPMGSDSFAEQWLQKDGGGAVAVIAGTSITNTHENDLLMEYLFKAVYDHHITRHAQALAWAEERMHTDRPGLNSWRYLLFGDPSMRIRTDNPIDWNPIPDDIAANQGPDGSVEVQVLDAADAPLEGVLVSAYQPGTDGFQVNGYTDAYGMVQLMADADAWSGPVQIVVADQLGNQTSLEVPVANGAWTDLGGGSTGSFGAPLLTATGTLAAQHPYSVHVSGAHPVSPALLVVSLASMPVAFKDVTLQAFPIAAQFHLATNAAGGIDLSGDWPAGVPAGLEFWLQTLVADVGIPSGVTITNAVKGTTP